MKTTRKGMLSPRKTRTTKTTIASVGERRRRMRRVREFFADPTPKVWATVCPPRTTETNAREYLGRIGVDSGRVLIVDPCYERPAGGLAVMNLSVTLESGYGDVCYPVFATRDKDGRLVRVTVEMV